MIILVIIVGLSQRISVWIPVKCSIIKCYFTKPNFLMLSMYDLKIQKMNLAMQLIFHSISFPQTNFDRSFFGILNNRVWDKKKHFFKKKYKSFWELRVPRMFPIQSIQHGKDLGTVNFFPISIYIYTYIISIFI